MIGKEYSDPKFGGAPGVDMPFRSETFYYKNDPIITNARRIITQGRVNPDTATVGSKYWASYEQGTKKLFSKGTDICEFRNTYLFINNVSSTSYSLTLDIESIAFETGAFKGIGAVMVTGLGIVMIFV